MAISDMAINEIIALVVAIGALAIARLVWELAHCAEESAELEQASADEVTQQEDWQK